MASMSPKEQREAFANSMIAEFNQLLMLEEDGTGFLVEVIKLFCVDSERIVGELSNLLDQLIMDFQKIEDALKIDDKFPSALYMLGSLELENDYWVKAKDTFRVSSDATDGKDSYSTLSLGNWNYFAATRSER